MDRNSVKDAIKLLYKLSLSARRAWIEIIIVSDNFVLELSLSARRAWIEILIRLVKFVCFAVALRKESVDRNLWWGVRKAVGSLVALRKESVDRNPVGVYVLIMERGRSPQGERG